LAVITIGSVVAAALFKGERDAARTNESRAVDAERGTKLMFFDALRSVPGEVRGMRLRGEPGAYADGMPKLRDTLAKARALGAPPEVAHVVRNEMMNLLTAPDVTVEREWDLPELEGRGGADFDPASGQFAFVNVDRSRVTLTPLNGRTTRTVTGSLIWFCPDGRKGVSHASGPNPDLRVTCWDLGSSPSRALWERTGVDTGAFTPDGRGVMLSGLPYGFDDTLLVNAEDGHEEGRFKDYGLCFGLPIHPDPARPWAALQQVNRPIRVVNYRTQENVAEVVGETRQNLAWHPTRPVLAFTDLNYRIHLVDVTNGKDVLPPLEGHNDAGIMLRFDRTGDRLVSWDWGGTVRVWDLTTGHQVFRTPVASVYAAWFDPGGDVLMAHHVGQTRHQLLRIRLGEGLRVAADTPGQDRSRYDGPAFVSPDGRLLVARQRKGSDAEMTRIGDPMTGAEMAVLPNRTIPVGFEQPSGSLITHHVNRGFERWPVAAVGGGRVRVGPPEQLVAKGGYGLQAGMSPDGRILVRPRPGNNFDAEIFHLGNPLRTVVTKAHQADIRFASVSPDKQWVVAGSHSGNAGVRVYDADTGEMVAQLHDASGSGKFSPDGAWVAISDYRGEGKLVRAGTWTDHLTLHGENCFSHDGRLIAVGEGVGTVRLLECETGREVSRLEVADPTWLNPVAISPDGGRLYAVGKDAYALHLWSWDLRHLRSRLKSLGADWDWPEFPPAPPIEKVTVVDVVMPK
jgi:WD40 repeat protein